MSRFTLIAGSFALSIATVFVMILDTGPPKPTEDLFGGLHLSAPIPIDIPDDDASLSPTVRYQSATHGYELTYPATWTLDDSKEDFDGDILFDPTEQTVITISETQDESLMDENAVEMLTRSIRESLQLDPAFQLDALKHLQWKDRQTIFTNGKRHLGSRVLHTREYNIFRPHHGGILNISITTQSSSQQFHRAAIESILNSLDVCPTLPL